MPPLSSTSQSPIVPVCKSRLVWLRWRSEAPRDGDLRQPRPADDGIMLLGKIGPPTSGNAGGPWSFQLGGMQFNCSSLPAADLTLCNRRSIPTGSVAAAD